MSLGSDITRDLASAVDEVIERKLKIAAAMLPAAEVATAHLHIGVGLVFQAIGNTVANRRDGADPAAVYDTIAQIVIEMIGKGKVEVLAKVAEAKAGAVK